MSVGVKSPTDRSQSDCVHEQVAKADCECPLTKSKNILEKRETSNYGYTSIFIYRFYG